MLGTGNIPHFHRDGRGVARPSILIIIITVRPYRRRNLGRSAPQSNLGPPAAPPLREKPEAVLADSDSRIEVRRAEVGLK